MKKKVLIHLHAPHQWWWLKTMVFSWIQELQNLYDFEILFFWDHSPYESRFLEKNIPVHYLPKITKNWNFSRIYKDFLHNNRYDIVWTHGPVDSFENMLFFMYIKKYIKSLRVCHSHSSFSSQPFLVRLCVYPFISLFLRWWGNIFFACTKESGNWLFGKKAETITIPNGIDTKTFAYNEEKRQKVRKELWLENKLILISIGRLSVEKNQVFLLDVFAKFQKKRKDVALLLIGDWPLKESLLEKSCHLWISNKVHFLGQRNNVIDLLSASDVFCFPSLYEWFGLVAIEAQCNGLPCLISDSINSAVNILKERNFILPIDRGVNPWVDALENMREYTRTWDERIRESGYDISNSAKKISDVFEKI